MQKKCLHFIAFILLSLVVQTTFAQQSQALTQIKNYAISHQKQLSISPKDVEGLFVTRDYKDASTGIQHIYSVQKFNGLTVIGSSFSLHVTGAIQTHANRLLSLDKYRTLPVNAAVPATTAIANVMDAIGYTADKKIEVKQAAQGKDQYTVYKRNEFSIWDIPVRLVYYSSEHLRSLVPAWEVQMMDSYKRHYWLAYVDAAPVKCWRKETLIVHCNFEGMALPMHLYQQTRIAAFAEQ